MLCLSAFHFPDREETAEFMIGDMRAKRTCYSSRYPFGVLDDLELGDMRFEPITILYGSNGSGKSTALNIIAEKLGLPRDARYNRSAFMPMYLELCRAELRQPVPEGSVILTSDDVFDAMLNLRAMSEGIDLRREELFREYLDATPASYPYLVPLL